MKQTEESFLSDIVDLNSVQKDKLNLIIAPCGSGKTTLALEKMPDKHCIDPGRTIYLIDTLAGMEQLLKRSECQCYDSEILDPDHYFFSDRPHKITVFTYAKFGALAHYFPRWYDYLDTIICDEIHKLPEMMSWKKSAEENLYQSAWDAIMDCAVSNDKPTVIGMTATPLQLYRKVNAICKFSKEHGHIIWESPLVNQVIINGKPKRYRPKQVVHYQNLTILCNSLQLDKKGIIYLPRISMMKQYSELLERRGLRTASIWSVHNTDYPMTEEQQNIRKSLIQSESIPNDIDILLINKSCETSINIKSHVDYMVIHSTESDTKKQALGRYRGNLDLVYIFWPSETSKIDLPDEMLNTPLYKEDLNIFIIENNIRNNKGELMKAPTFKKLLQSQGYLITEDKIRGGKRYVVISE